MKLRVLIADDEPLSREAVRRSLQQSEDFEIAGEVADGSETVSAIRSLKPDVVFLDVQMPDMDGFKVVEEIGPLNMPITVFVTAHDKYAVRAFDIHAVDYLLKPFDEERFARALHHIRVEAMSRDTGNLSDRLMALIEGKDPKSGFLDRLIIRSGGRIVFVPVDEVNWIQSEGNYLRIHAGSTTHMMRETMNAIEAKLDPKRFVRIHRSFIVRIDAIKELRPWYTGEYVVLLHDGQELTMSRGYRHAIQSLLGQ